MKMLLVRRWQRWLRWMFTLLLVFLFWITARLVLFEVFNSPSDQVSNEKRLHSLWSPNPADEMWLPRVKTHRSDETPLVVVEEHYEVLKYWFQAAQFDFIPKSKNMLIHIDGHVDGAVPFNVDSIPWFRFPRSPQEVHNMMQRNDMFIISAVLTGFIDHVIWIWPDWDKESHEGPETDHMIIDFQMGYTKPLALCACWKVRSSEGGTVRQGMKQEDSLDWECRRHNDSEVDIEIGPLMKRSDCQIQGQGVLETLSESKAVTVLKAMEEHDRLGGLILDIDEDYFGCWSDMIPFSEAGIVQEKVDMISELVSDFLCAFSPRQEQDADHYYTAIINLIISLKLKSCDVDRPPGEKRCLKDVDISNYLIENVPNILEFLFSHKKQHVLCAQEEKLNGLRLQSLLAVLTNFSVDQLKSLSKVGICFSTSPSSIHFPVSGILHVCHGDNTPEKTEVTFSLPENKDVIAQTKTLKKILSSIFRKPDVISVCRSIRDGYTPKEYFRMIESAVLTSVSAVYRSVSLKSVHFDGNLLGGALGWPERKQSWNSKLTSFLKFDT
ncbi:UPF0489 protein C5orf22 homolog [Aplysia californica]|uniref:UPF0489 protein C5orf22 homolog n=1 Tax=Aplysia californica TaxID=6500 RepID=A0ABM0JNC4_APLCA|nr:UPF0489 protein C5orf22 homolog [Aplysia californica]